MEGKRGRRGAHLDGINVEVTEAEAPARVVDDCLIRLLVVFVLIVVEGEVSVSSRVCETRKGRKKSARERGSRGGDAEKAGSRLT